MAKCGETGCFSGGKSDGEPWHVFRYVAECDVKDREEQTVISDLDGTLCRGRSSFPYFMLIAFEAGGYLRATALLLCAPLIWFLYDFVSEAAGIKVLIFVTFAGIEVRKIETVSRAVLPKFYCDDIHSDAYRVFTSFGKRYILTANPRIMVEDFARDYLSADEVLGTEIEVTEKGRATGFVKSPGVLVGEHKENALKAAFADRAPDVGMGDRPTDFPFMSLCKEGYVVPSTPAASLPKEMLPKPMVFHDGRFVQRPDPGMAFVLLLWYPFGFLLATVRIISTLLLSPLPLHIAANVLRFTGVKIKVIGSPPASPKDGKSGVLFVCNHRTLMDPVFVALALGRQVAAVTYSISRLSEKLSPIKSVAMTRRRKEDKEVMEKLLQNGDLAICPEGTTCRESFTLRFSALFAELTDQIVPVAVTTRTSLFHGTTANGWKGMDTFFFMMNLRPEYQITFLQQLRFGQTCSGGKSSFEVANHIQRAISGALNYECTSLTRRDKYLAVAKSDGTVAPKPVPISIRKLIKSKSLKLVADIKKFSAPRMEVGSMPSTTCR